MKYLLLFFCIAWLPLVKPAEAAASRPAVPDTVAGHARMVRKLNGALCTEITNEARTTAFDKLSPLDAQQLLQRLFVAAMQQDSVAVLAMMSDAAKQNVDQREVGRQLGTDVVVLLSRGCPAALPIIARFSQSGPVQQAVATKLPTLTDAEKSVLQPLANNICTNLAADDAKTPFTKRSPAQRSTLFSGLIQQEIVSGRAQLLRYYSAAQLADKQQMEAIGQKMAVLMIKSSSCAQYIMLIGADELAKPKQ